MSLRFFRSSVGRKVIMAITGLLLIGFVVAHLLGNLGVYAGQDSFNTYAAFLKDLGPLLWAARIGLLVVFLLHVTTAFSLTKTNKLARENDYKDESTVQASLASLYMFESGLVILAFVIIHLLHFTFGYLHPEHYELVDAQGRHDVYSMLILGFKNVVFSVGYIIAMCFLGLHLSHAISSMFKSVGVMKPGLAPSIEKGATALAALIALAYISIPLSVLTGILTLPNGVAQ